MRSIFKLIIHFSLKTKILVLKSLLIVYLNFEEKIINLKSNIMKALKITLIVALFFTALTSCTKQDLNEDDVLVSPETQTTVYIGGDIDE